MDLKIIRKVNADFLGISASIICAIHCAIWPLVLMLLPIGSLWSENVYVEYCLLGFSFLIGIWSLGRGYLMHHKRFLSVFIFIISFSILLLAHFYIENSLELLLIFLAAIGIIIAHLLNYRWMKICKI
ncbi:MerC domain-containing protein [Chitinophaga silvatica]|uniref:MerC domain-containing protein n=1 Tax=Chitinophaga silvatica TaxID=2282649 RepID=A0A3E1Y9H4_9BACT|nr:MerC domain-containing protein [Chitinophaga silvatica]